MVPASQHHRTSLLLTQSSNHQTTLRPGRVPIETLVLTTPSLSLSFSLSKNLFENNQHRQLVIILSQSIPVAHLNEICTQHSFDSIVLLTSCPSLMDDTKNELAEHLFDILQLKYLPFPFVSITDAFFLTPTLIPYRLPSIETLTSLSSDKIKVRMQMPHLPLVTNLLFDLDNDITGSNVPTRGNQNHSSEPLSMSHEAHTCSTELFRCTLNS